MQFARALALWQIQTFCRIYYRKSLLLNGKQEQYETFSDHKNLPLLLQTYKPYEIVSFMSKQNGRKLREDTEKYTFLRIRDLFNGLNRYAGHIRTQKIRQATLTMLGTRIPFYYLALGPRPLPGKHRNSKQEAAVQFSTDFGQDAEEETAGPSNHSPKRRRLISSSKPHLVADIFPTQSSSSYNELPIYASGTLIAMTADRHFEEVFWVGSLMDDVYEGRHGLRPSLIRLQFFCLDSAEEKYMADLQEPPVKVSVSKIIYDIPDNTSVTTIKEPVHNALELLASKKQETTLRNSNPYAKTTYRVRNLLVRPTRESFLESDPDLDQEVGDIAAGDDDDEELAPCDFADDASDGDASDSGDVLPSEENIDDLRP